MELGNGTTQQTQRTFACANLLQGSHQLVTDLLLFTDYTKAAMGKLVKWILAFT